ncbi:MAG: hypothetical protein K0S30_298 [Clostridia bacterium]|jgi:hypothetical protein|nr:hypothetical protein [Clostridia bacterium]
MSTLLTQQQLENHLYTFRHILSHFDYSPIKNVRFLNLDAFFAYMETIKNNPFQKQYAQLQEELDSIQPYLPFVSSQRAKDFLNELSIATDENDVEKIKKQYTHKLRQDFINVSKTITTEEEWKNITLICEEIRLRKEEMLLALH